MRKFMIFGLVIPCFSATSIVSIEPTQMQAKVTVRTDQTGHCTYRASRGPNFGANIADLTDNGDTDARTGSLVEGSNHFFVLGTRKGADALGAAAAYWIGVTCGADKEVAKVFTTLPVPWGNLAPDLVPFNGARFGNMDYPFIDWSDQSKSYVDPVEGLEFWRLTGPGLLNPGAFTAQYNQTAAAPIDLTGSGNWTNVASVATNGKTYAIASGGASDRVFIPIAAGNFYGSSGWITKTNVDDVLANVYCGNASQSNITLTLQFTLDGGQTLVGAPVTTAPCPQASPEKIGVYPRARPKPLFRGWSMNPPQHNLIIPPAGTVSVANSVVALQAPSGSNNYFVTEWPPGTPILINGAYYHIASIQSPAQLTIAENPGTLAGVPYSGANAGIVVFKNGSGSVNVSLGLDLYGSSVPDNGVNGGAPMVNPIPVTVSKTADGAAGLSPALTGYMAYLTDQGGSGSIVLWVPYNADGSTRNEIRLLSVGTKPATSARLHAAGDPVQYSVGVNPRAGTVYDGVDGKSWFGLSADNLHFFRMTYDEKLTGCAGFPAFNPYPASGGYNNGTGMVADDCFQWYNLNPSRTNPPMDVLSQMKRAYQTGRNSLGETVGPPHPNFDLGWFGSPSAGFTDGGYLTANISNRGEHLSIFAAFDKQTGIIKLIKNMWGGDGDTEARWGGVHGITLAAGTWRWASMNGLDDNTGAPGQQVFNSAFDLPIAKVNRAGYGSTPRWDTNTSLSGTEAYTCPSSVPSRYRSLAGTRNCVQVKVTTPPCNATPNSTYVFPDGKIEKDEFPCATPGFGVADPARSKLMDIQPGDWLRERRTGQLNEQFVALAVTYNGTNDIDIWLLRWARHNYLLPLLNNGDDYVPVYDVRPNGWFLSMAPSLNVGPSSLAIDLSAGGAAKWLPDNGQRAGCHGVIGPGTVPGLYIYAEPCDPPTYRGQFDVPPAAMIFQPFLPMGAGYPGFAGSNAGVNRGVVQNYNNNTWWFGAANPPFQLDFRHLNPAFGAGPEYLNSGIGAPRSITLVPGTKKSYLITDSLSAGPSDYKRLPLHGYAGHYLLKDVSGPATGNTSDLPDYSFCRASNPGECFASSAVGSLYVTVPGAIAGSYCHSDQFTLPIPCVFQLAPFAGQVLQFRTDKLDASGLTVRKLGYVHGMPGLQYQFSNCRVTPDAAFAFCVADWLDGVRSEWVALKLNPMPGPDNINRTTFVPIPVARQGTAGASCIRARFGYLENGGSLLRCTAYQAECSTEIPSNAARDPYSFTNERVTRQRCPVGATCTITIPAISNRMLYYVIDRLDNNGKLVSSDPMQVVPVP
jgi:hypothetical protein